MTFHFVSVLSMQHELTKLRRKIADPERQAAKARQSERARTAAAEESLSVARDTRLAAESKLGSRRQELEAEQAATKTLEARVRDTEGDWA